MKKIITALTLFCIISVVISCAKRQNSTLDFPKLSMAMDSNPDSVYNVLTDFSGKLSPDDYPLYCFLLVQSIDKTYRHIDTDTLINVGIINILPILAFYPKSITVQGGYTKKWRIIQNLFITI